MSGEIRLPDYPAVGGAIAQYTFVEINASQWEAAEANDQQVAVATGGADAAGDLVAASIGEVWVECGETMAALSPIKVGASSKAEIADAAADNAVGIALSPGTSGERMRAYIFGITVDTI